MSGDIRNRSDYSTKEIRAAEYVRMSTDDQ